MGDWRRHRGRNYNNREMMQKGTRLQTGKPPFANREWSVPEWEKKFCSSVGTVPWCNVLRAGVFMYLHRKVTQWDDSAGEEAFKNAKARFWAKINGLPCNISLPDPDIYIDDVDWDAEVDTELILDLERDSEDRLEMAKNEHIPLLDTCILFGQYTVIGCTVSEDGNSNNSNAFAGYGCRGNLGRLDF